MGNPGQFRHRPSGSGLKEASVMHIGSSLEASVLCGVNVLYDGAGIDQEVD